MGFSWVGVQQFLDDKREERLIKEDRLAKRKEFIFRTMLPELMKRRADSKKAQKQAELIYRKGLQLFGKDTATALENMGELGTVVSQYESTEGGKEWAQVVTARTEKFLKGMLESEDKVQRETALRLLQRGAFLGDASEGEKSDYLNELTATGVFSEEDLEDFDLGGGLGTNYTGPLPELGTYETLSPVQLRETSRELAGSIIPGARIERTPEGVKIITPDNVSPRFVQAVELEIADRIKRGQYQEGPIETQRFVFQDFSNNWDTLSKEIADTYNVPYPTGLGTDPQLDTEGAGIDATSMELQEGMGDIATPETTVPTVPTNNTWQPGVLDPNE